MHVIGALSSDAAARPRQRLLIPILGMLVVGGRLLHAGIPEPDLVWYGKVLSTSGGSTVRLTAGTLTWQIEPLVGGTPIVITTSLTNLNDQFSYVLRVPCQSPEPGVGADAGALVLSDPAATYRRMTVTLDGEPLSLLNASGELAPTAADRGRLERLDLGLGIVLPDADGDGLPDAWEQQYFGLAGTTPGFDADGDGMTNLREFLAGTNPIDAGSLFEAIDIDGAENGVSIRWSSQPGRVYRVRRSATLLAAPADYAIVQGGILATPPVNEFIDTAADPTGQYFYFIEIEP